VAPVDGRGVVDVEAVDNVAVDNVDIMDRRRQCDERFQEVLDDVTRRRWTL
jgi:hypothetical protein